MLRWGTQGCLYAQGNVGKETAPGIILPLSRSCFLPKAAPAPRTTPGPAVAERELVKCSHSGFFNPLPPSSLQCLSLICPRPHPLREPAASLVLPPDPVQGFAGFPHSPALVCSHASVMCAGGQCTEGVGMGECNGWV